MVLCIIITITILNKERVRVIEIFVQREGRELLLFHDDVFGLLITFREST